LTTDGGFSFLQFSYSRLNLIVRERIYVAGLLHAASTIAAAIQEIVRVVQLSTADRTLHFFFGVGGVTFRTSAIASSNLKGRILIFFSLLMESLLVFSGLSEIVRLWLAHYIIR